MTAKIAHENDNPGSPRAEAPGIAERLRTASAASTPRAALGRGTAGVRARTLIVNLPGSPNGVTESLDALAPVAEHAIAILRGAPDDHAAMKSGAAERGVSRRTHDA